MQQSLNKKEERKSVEKFSKRTVDKITSEELEISTNILNWKRSKAFSFY